MQRFLKVLLILAFFAFGSGAGAEEYSDEERLLGFAQQQRRNAQMDKERESAAGSVKKAREEWDKDLSEAVESYKKWKSRQSAALDESSTEYKQDIEFKKRQDKELEDAQERFVRARNQKRAQKKATVHLTEEHEYGLDEVPDRIDISKRKLYNASAGRGGSSGRGSSAGSGGGSTDFATPPPDFNPPASAAPPAAPEFFEPEIPPPPPPAEFDESIPPPIFDDNEF